MDFLDHYKLSSDEPIWSLAEAKKLAANDDDRIWFVRHGDGSCECDPDDEEIIECDCEETWDVALYTGQQFVNKAGFFVTTEPCKPEHRDTIFTY